MTTRKILLFLAVFAAVGSWAGEASAKKKGPLEGEPIVRKKLDLRRLRFQIAPYVGMSLSQPFVHMGYVGAKATFHFADWIGLRAGFGYGVVPVESRLLKDINSGAVPEGVPQNGVVGPGVTCAGPAPCREALDDPNPAPLLHDVRAGLVRAQWQSSVDVVFTPFSGKLGLFRSIFTEYDIYVFGGLGLVGYRKHYGDARSTAQQNGLNTNPDSGSYCAVNPDSLPNQECQLHPVSPDEGVKVGGSFGVGLHLFLTDWVAINFEIQDIVTRVNLAGLNATIDDIPPRVDRRDRDTFHNVTFQLGANFYLPPKAKRTK